MTELTVWMSALDTEDIVSKRRVMANLLRRDTEIKSENRSLLGDGERMIRRTWRERQGCQGFVRKRKEASD